MEGWTWRRRKTEISKIRSGNEPPRTTVRRIITDRLPKLEIDLQLPTRVAIETLRQKMRTDERSWINFYEVIALLREAKVAEKKDGLTAPAPTGH